MPQDTIPNFDMKPVQAETSHTSRTIIIWVSIIVVVLGALYVGLSIKAKRDRDAYLKTPEGQLEALEATSAPVTATPEERARVMAELKGSSPQTPLSQEDLLSQLPAAQ